jgi:hypothetical protein
MSSSTAVTNSSRAGSRPLRPAHRCGRVHRQHLSGDEPVEQHSHGRELLLHTRRPVLLLQLLDPSRHIERPHRREREAAIVAGWIVQTDNISETADSNRFGYISDICITLTT